MNDIFLLTKAIEVVHGCDSVHERSMPVKHKRAGKPVWEGSVEIFRLSGHPETKEVFAWNYESTDGRIQSVTVLKVPPVETPLDAVKSAMRSGSAGQS